jgi:hypothetical protein
MKRKQIAFALVIINFIYSVSQIWLFFHLNNQIIIDITKAPPSGLDISSIWGIVPEILGLIILLGLCWVLRAYKEKLWILLGMVLFTFWKIISGISFYLYGMQWASGMPSLFNALLDLYYFTLVYMVITLFFVRNKVIKWCFIWFGIFTAIAYIIPKVGPYLYDNFNIHWLMINQDALLQLCTFTSLVLFIRVWIDTDNKQANAN